ncbi:MAG TPA: HD domain-containing phosphohydrolase [Bacilli bacterium]
MFSYVAEHIALILPVMMLVTAACLAAFFFMLKKARLMKKRWLRSLDLGRRIAPENGLEQNLTRMLEMVAAMVTAPTYTFYIHDQNKNVHLLRAVHHQAPNFGKVEPSYSGLAEYKKEQYLPPLSIAPEVSPAKLRMRKVGRVEFLDIPVADIGLIRVGPMRKYHYNRKIKRELEAFQEMAQNSLRQLLMLEEVRNKSTVIVTAGQAMQRINSIALDVNSTTDFMLNLAMKITQADGGFFAVQSGDRFRLAAISKDANFRHDLLPRDELAGILVKLSELKREQADIRLFSENENDFYKLPPEIAATGARTVAIIDLSERREEPCRRMMVLWHLAPPQQAVWKEACASLRPVIGNMREVLGQQQLFRGFSAHYVDILKTLAQLQDNLAVYTAGRSELMGKYAMVIAREMGLAAEEIRNVALAAYLSNIGNIGISLDLVHKEGRFSEAEYELIKLHAEVGASIVQSMLGNERASSYILHHHERMDGNGYPAGLTGNEIPFGARIIAVVETFLALTSGRKYRQPLSFEQAIERLRNAAGTHLDASIVDLFLNWFARKQAELTG